MVRRVRVALVACALLLLPTTASAATLQAGVGRSDVTPPTGFYTMGYVRSDAVARGQHTRLFARAIVLREGNRKLALVATDLGFIPGGLLADVANQVSKRGFSERNVIVSASHTHSAPAGYANYQSDNFVAPTAGTPTEFKTAGDPQLYGFLVKRVALAIVRADRRLGPARAGWGAAALAGVTDNRSLEAHLANFGYDLPYGTGRVDQDPRGYIGTIDPQVDVLRVDRVAAGGRSVPLGAWLDFADHGTVNPFTFGVYNADHHGPASRIFEAAVRRAGHVPRKQDVVGAYGNGDAGDMTAGLRGRGPAYAERVGSREARAMLSGWRRAGGHMARSLPFAVRWTRSCFCGRTVSGGQVADTPYMGYPFFTGSEESRGPLYDQTHVKSRGRTAALRRRAPGPEDPDRRPAGGRLPDRCAVDGRAARRPGGRDDPRRDDRGDGAPHAGGGARRARGGGRQAGHAGRLRERVPALLHDARGVRDAALRGRLHAVRQVQLEPDQGRPHDARGRHSPRCGGARAGELRPPQRARARLHAVRLGRGVREGLRAACERAAAASRDVRLEGRGARARSTLRPRLRLRAAASRQALAERDRRPRAPDPLARRRQRTLHGGVAGAACRGGGPLPLRGDRAALSAGVEAIRRVGLEGTGGPLARRRARDA